MSENYKTPTVKNIYGISPSFLPIPKDYASQSKFHGFWFGDAKEELSSELMDFLNAGEAPLLLTFGSMPFKSKFDLQAAILKLNMQLKVRFLIVKGWGINHTEEFENNPNIKVIESVPYEKLFPMVRAIIHHGGIGTTAECLRAGKPFMICPILYPVGDQQFWGNLAYKMGLAVKPIPLSKMTEKKFLSSVDKLLHSMEFFENARKMKLKIEMENGIHRTVAEIENYAQERKSS